MLTNSKIFLEIVRVINQIQKTGQRLSYKDILQRLQNVYGDEVTSQERRLFPEVLNYYFGITEKKMTSKKWRNEPLNIPIKASIPIRVTCYELCWLKSMLCDSASDFLIHDQLRNKLLRNIDAYFGDAEIAILKEFDTKNFWAPNYMRPESTLTTEFRDKLATIWQAMISHRKIRYINVTPNKTWKGIEAPCRLEFDCAFGTYNLIIWPNKEKRPVKMHVDRLKLVELTDELFDENIINDAFKKSLEEKKEHAIIQLFDIKDTNALNRFYTRFEGYDKDSHQDDKDNKLYHITLYYYNFDKNDVLHGLMSLGPLIQVISPSYLREKIIENYQKAAERMRGFS